MARTGHVDGDDDGEAASAAAHPLPVLRRTGTSSADRVS